MMDGANCLPFFQESEIEGPARRNQLPDGLCHGLGQGGRLWSWLGRQRNFPFLGTWQRCAFTRFCPEKKLQQKTIHEDYSHELKRTKNYINNFELKSFCNVLFSSIPRFNLKMFQNFSTQWKKRVYNYLLQNWYLKK